MACRWTCIDWLSGCKRILATVRLTSVCAGWCCADGKEIVLEPPVGDELPRAGFDPGQDTYQAPPSTAERNKLNVAVDPNSNRLQLLSPFKPWNGEDIKDAAVLIKVGTCSTHCNLAMS